MKSSNIKRCSAATLQIFNCGHAALRNVTKLTSGIILFYSYESDRSYDSHPRFDCALISYRSTVHSKSHIVYEMRADYTCIVYMHVARRWPLAMLAF